MTGAPFINAARTDMLGSIDGLAHAIGDRGFLVVFDPIADPRFGSIDPP
jgi:hypothetical protein